MDYVSVGEAVRRLCTEGETGQGRLKPQDLTSLFYQRRLDTERCPIIAGRRLIPVDYLPSIEIELRRAGKLPRLAVRRAI